MTTKFQTKKLGEIAEIVIGGTPSRREKRFFEGNNLWVSIRDLNQGKYILKTKEKISDDGIKKSNVKLIPKGTLMMSFKLSLGKLAFAGEDLYTNEAIAAFVIKDKAIDKNYLYYYLKTIDFDGTTDSSVKGKTLNKKKIQEIVINYPNIEEQKRIVNKLDKIFEKNERAIKLAKQNLILSRENTSNFLDMTFEELQKNEQMKKIQELATLVQYGTSQKTSAQGEYTVLRMGNLQNGEIDYSNLKYINLNKEEASKYILKNGDILFNRTNSFELVGKTSIFEGKPNTLFASYLIRLEVDQKTVNAHYLNYFLNSGIAQKYLKSIANKAISQANINAQKLQSVAVPIPSLDMQNALVKRFHSIKIASKNLEEKFISKLQYLEQLKESLLNSAFQGEL